MSKTAVSKATLVTTVDTIATLEAVSKMPVLALSLALILNAVDVACVSASTETSVPLILISKCVGKAVEIATRSEWNDSTIENILLFESGFEFLRDMLLVNPCAVVGKSV